MASGDWYTNRAAWAEGKLGPRGSARISHKERGIARTWLQGALKATYKQIMGVSLPETQEAYNDVTGAALERVRAKYCNGAEAPKEEGMAEALKLEGEAAQAEAQVNGNGHKTGVAGAERAAQGIIEALGHLRVQASMDEARVRAIAAEEAGKVKAPERVVVIERKPEGEERRDLGVQHRAFPLLLKCLDAGLHVALVGPAGTGKTTAAHRAADALGLPFECQSFSGTTTKSDLVGFIDANGHYRDTPLRRSYVATEERPKGGVFCGDEFDAGNANANVIINAALANGLCAFPDGMMERADGFRCVIAMNTHGQGANRQYVGRNQLDAATLDRFVFLSWDLDEALEASLLGLTEKQGALDLGLGGFMEPKAWLSRVRKVRAAVEELAVRHLVTPRASQYGAALFGAGVGRHWVEEMVLWRGLDSEQRARVESKAGKS